MTIQGSGIAEKDYTTLSNTVAESNKGNEKSTKENQLGSATETQKSNSAPTDASLSNQLKEDAETHTSEEPDSKDSVHTTKDTGTDKKCNDTVTPENAEPTPPSDKPNDSASSTPPLRGPVKKRSSQLGSMARKKRKSQLADMSAAVTSAPIKMNTLEKSKLDWEAFKGNIATDDNRNTMSAAERDELDSQTQGGGSGLGDVKGYLHRKEFLDRVHGRLDQQEYEHHVSR